MCLEFLACCRYSALCSVCVLLLDISLYLLERRASGNASVEVNDRAGNVSYSLFISRAALAMLSVHLACGSRVSSSCPSSQAPMQPSIRVLLTGAPVANLLPHGYKSPSPALLVIPEQDPIGISPLRGIWC